MTIKTNQRKKDLRITLNPVIASIAPVIRKISIIKRYSCSDNFITSQIFIQHATFIQIRSRVHQKSTLQLYYLTHLAKGSQPELSN